MAVLAGINLIVIALGFYTCYIRFIYTEKRFRIKILLFFFAALSCLIVAEVDFLSGFFDFTSCG